MENIDEKTNGVTAAHGTFLLHTLRADLLAALPSSIHRMKLVHGLQLLFEFAAAVWLVLPKWANAIR